MTKHLLTALLLLGCARAAEKPNILVIVSDDHGYADVGFHGCRDIPTPHLDALAKSGVRCTSGYVTHPFCSPTRAGLMTGRYQHRFGHENNPFYDPSNDTEGLPVSEKLLPAHLKEAGYDTGWIGKWHLGAAPQFRPLARGFMEGFGFIGGGHRFLNWQPNIKSEYLVPIQRNAEDVPENTHLTTAFGREGAAFVRRHEAKPWFLYLAFNAPHMPHEPTKERLERFSSISDPKRRNYAAQLSLMDDAIGETLAALRESGQEKRTLVFFFSDNGGPIKQGSPNGSVNLPLRGGKGDLLEGGIRVPFVVSWPSRLPAGSEVATPVSSLDVFATAFSAAGLPMPTDKKYDGVNLLPHLSGEAKSAPQRQLFWKRGPQQAIRDGNLKLIRTGGGPPELYDLAADIGETKNLADSRAEDVSRLTAALDSWSSELKPPAFSGAGKPKKAAPKQTSN